MSNRILRGALYRVSFAWRREGKGLNNGKWAKTDGIVRDVVSHQSGLSSWWSFIRVIPLCCETQTAWLTVCHPFVTTSPIIICTNVHRVNEFHLRWSLGWTGRAYLWQAAETSACFHGLEWEGRCVFLIWMIFFFFFCGWFRFHLRLLTFWFWASVITHSLL